MFNAKKIDDSFLKSSIDNSTRKTLIADLSNRRKKLFIISIACICLSFLIPIFEKFSDFSNYYARNTFLVFSGFSLVFGMIVDSKIKLLKTIDNLIVKKNIMRPFHSRQCFQRGF